MKIAILDDYQNVALTFGDWASLEADITVFTKPLEVVVEQLKGFEVVVAMRERTRFPAEVLDRLPELKLLVSTGRRNAAIDVAAARRNGVVVSATGYIGEPTTEHTWALILAAARDLPAALRSMREGGWGSVACSATATTARRSLRTIRGGRSGTRSAPRTSGSSRARPTRASTATPSRTSRPIKQASRSAFSSKALTWLCGLYGGCA